MSVQSEINRISSEVSTQANLISQIKTTLEGKAAGGGIDTSDATATASDILSGKTAYAKGSKVTGTIATKTSSNLTASGAAVTVPAGYYASQASKSVGTATQATPSISVNSSGLITASATQTAGYVSAGTKSGTKQLTVQAAQTITPGTSDKTIASGRYLTGTQTIKGDSNLIPANIAEGVTIFGVTGTHSGGSGGSGGSLETISGRIWFDGLPAPDVTGGSVYYIDGSSEVKTTSWNTDISARISVLKNSIVVVTGWSSMSTVSGGSLVYYNMQTGVYFVTDDGFILSNMG